MHMSPSLFCHAHHMTPFPEEQKHTMEQAGLKHQRLRVFNELRFPARCWGMAQNHYQSPQMILLPHTVDWSWQHITLGF